MPRGKLSQPDHSSTRASHHRLRKIHVDLPEEVHRKLRVKAALQDTSIRAFVAEVVREAVKDVVIPTARPALRGRHE